MVVLKHAQQSRGLSAQLLQVPCVMLFALVLWHPLCHSCVPCRHVTVPMVSPFSRRVGCLSAVACLSACCGLPALPVTRTARLDCLTRTGPVASTNSLAASAQPLHLPCLIVVSGVVLLIQVVWRANTCSLHKTCGAAVGCLAGRSDCAWVAPVGCAVSLEPTDS